MTYQAFAHVYDQLMEHAPYDAWVQFTESILEKHERQAKTVLELGCGTGEVALRLARIGYHVTGVDYSTDMLSCAMEKSLEEQLPVQWIQQDITELVGFNEIDVCISYCDVMNYITNKADMKSVCYRVYESLSKQGLFIFDMHDIAYAKKDLMGHTFAEVTDELSYIWECEQAEAEEMDHYITLFQQEGSHYVRFDEVHQQKLYDRFWMKKLLTEIGFTKIEFYVDFNAEKVISEEKGERIFVMAQK